MSKPISLWRPKATLTSDAACTSILKYTIPPVTVSLPSSYCAPKKPLSYIPSLAYFCIQTLLDFPDQIHKLGHTKLHFQPAPTPEAYDILRALIPSYREHGTPDLTQVDPRLWALLVQVYTNLPESFRTYTLSLSDEHLPLLQRIPCTPNFAIITILELPGCRQLTDDTVIELKVLHGLCAFNASGTLLSSWGLSRLRKTLTFAEEVEQNTCMRYRRGPWGLRILSLRNCMNVKGDIVSTLEAFPLLSVVDLRGTCCCPNISTSFSPSQETKLFHPATLFDSLIRLSEISPESLFSHPAPFILRIAGLYHNKTGLRYAQSAAHSPSPDYPSLDRGRPVWADSTNAAGIDDRGHGGISVLIDHGMPRATDIRVSNTNSSRRRGGISALIDRTANANRRSDSMSALIDHRAPCAMNEHGSNTNTTTEAREDAAALTAQRLHALHQSAQRFYGSSLPSRTSNRTVTKARDEMSSDPIILSEPHPFMLFRRPPAWCSLSSDSSGLGEVEEAHLTKRARAEKDLDDRAQLRADKAQNSTHVQREISSFREMVQRRRAGHTLTNLVENTSMTPLPVGSSNPFVRKEGPQSSKGCSYGSTHQPRDIYEDCKDIAGSDRPLRPISSLKIPETPRDNSQGGKPRKLKMDKSTRKPSNKSNKSKQSTLLDFVRGPGPSQKS